MTYEELQAMARLAVQHAARRLGIPMMTFRLAPHSVRPGVEVVEIWDGDSFIGQIAPGDLPGELRVITKHTILPTLQLGSPLVLNVQIVRANDAER